MHMGIPNALRYAITTESFGQFDEANRMLNFNIETSQIPGFAIGTDENRRYGLGTPRLKPYVGIYDTISIVVRSDSEGKIYNFFQSWMKVIFNYDNPGVGIDEVTGWSTAGPTRTYEVGYLTDYATNSFLNVYDEEGGDPTVKIELIDCYPIHLGSATLDWHDPNILKFPVTLTFSDWRNDSINIVNRNVYDWDLPTIRRDNITPGTTPIEIISR